MDLELKGEGLQAITHMVIALGKIADTHAAILEHLKADLEFRREQAITAQQKEAALMQMFSPVLPLLSPSSAAAPEVLGGQPSPRLRRRHPDQPIFPRDPIR